MYMPYPDFLTSSIISSIYIANKYGEKWVWLVFKICCRRWKCFNANYGTNITKSRFSNHKLCCDSWTAQYNNSTALLNFMRLKNTKWDQPDTAVPDIKTSTLNQSDFILECNHKHHQTARLESPTLRYMGLPYFLCWNIGDSLSSILIDVFAVANTVLCMQALWCAVKNSGWQKMIKWHWWVCDNVTNLRWCVAQKLSTGSKKYRWALLLWSDWYLATIQFSLLARAYWSIQPCIPLGLLNQVPALAGVKTGKSPLLWGR